MTKAFVDISYHGALWVQIINKFLSREGNMQQFAQIRGKIGTTVRSSKEDNRFYILKDFGILGIIVGIDNCLQSVTLDGLIFGKVPSL